MKGQRSLPHALSVSGARLQCSGGGGLLCLSVVRLPRCGCCAVGMETSAARTSTDELRREKLMCGCLPWEGRLNRRSKSTHSAITASAMSLLLRLRRTPATIARFNPASSSSFMRGHRFLHSAALHRSSSSAAATPTPSPAAAASASASPVSASLSDASAALSSSPSTTLSLAQMDRARYHRRARLWMLAFFTSSTAALTLYRYFGQRDDQLNNIAQATEDVKQAADKLKRAQEAQTVRLQRVQQLLQAAAPANAAMIAAATPPAASAVTSAAPSPSSSSAPSASAVVAPSTPLPVAPAAVLAPAVPTSFLSAAVLDVQRALSLAAPDERVQLAALAAPKNAATAPAAADKPKQRQAIIM